MGLTTWLSTADRIVFNYCTTRVLFVYFRTSFQNDSFEDSQQKPIHCKQMSVDFEDISFFDFMIEVVSKAVDNIMRWFPGEEVDIDGRPLEPRQPTLWNFLYSNHLYLAIFVVRVCSYYSYLFFISFISLIINV